MSESEYQFFVGVDWGSATHVVCVLGPDRQLIGERSVPHTGIGLTALADELTALAPAEPGRIAVAIEAPRGAIVDTLLDRGLHVFSLNPKQLDRFRDRHTVAGAKDDRRDASSSRTHCAPIVRPSGACSPTNPLSTPKNRPISQRIRAVPGTCSKTGKRAAASACWPSTSAPASGGASTLRTSHQTRRQTSRRRCSSPVSLPA
jgi:Transposase